MRFVSDISIIGLPIFLLLPLFRPKSLIRYKGAALAYRLRQKMGGYYIGAGAVFSNKPFFPHGYNGIFISGGAAVGKNCVIFQQVTIGSDTLHGSNRCGSPALGDNCYIGAGAKIIGNVVIGDNCRIGANAVVYRDVPPNCTVVSGGGMRIIEHSSELDNRFYNQGPHGWQYWDGDQFVVCQDSSEL